VVGFDGRKLPDPKTLKDLGDGSETTTDASGNGQDVTVTTIEE